MSHTLGSTLSPTLSAHRPPTGWIENIMHFTPTLSSRTATAKLAQRDCSVKAIAAGLLICKFGAENACFFHFRFKTSGRVRSVRHYEMGCAKASSCVTAMESNFNLSRFGNLCESVSGRESTCHQCCFHPDCFNSQGYVERSGKLLNPSNWNILQWQKTLSLQ